MFKKLLSIALILTILTTVVRFTLPYLWYYGNYSYVATELCIHQHRSDHECNGKCQLKKMVQDQHDHADQHPAPSVEKEQKVNLFFANYIAFTTSPDASFAFIVKDFRRASLWIGEPISPPPQIG